MSTKTTGNWETATHVQAICHTEKKFVVDPNLLEQYGRQTIEQLVAAHDQSHDIEIILKNRKAPGVYQKT